MVTPHSFSVLKTFSGYSDLMLLAKTSRKVDANHCKVMHMRWKRIAITCVQWWLYVEH